jgi:hypothetical protein
MPAFPQYVFQPIEGMLLVKSFLRKFAGHLQAVASYRRDTLTIPVLRAFSRV